MFSLVRVFQFLLSCPVVSPYPQESPKICQTLLLQESAHMHTFSVFFHYSLIKLLPEGPRLFDTEYMTDQTEREISAELIREQLLHYTNQEIPHGTTVEIEKFEEKYKEDSADEYDRDRVVIRAAIICERNSHKGIIIGKNGAMIKRIGTSARIAIERLVGCKVYLDLFVKVREDWKNNEILLKDYGFQQEGDEKDGI